MTMILAKFRRKIFWKVVFDLLHADRKHDGGNIWKFCNFGLSEYQRCWSRYSPVDVVVVIQAEYAGNSGSIPVSGKIIFFFFFRASIRGLGPTHPPVYSVSRDLSVCYKRRRLKMTCHLYLVSRLRMSELLHTPSWRAHFKSYLYFTSYTKYLKSRDLFT